VPNLKISDGVNAAVDVTPNNDSALVKYFKNLSNLSVNGALLALRSGATLDDPAIQTVTAGINFASPVDVGTDQVELTVGGGLSGSLGVFKPQGTNAKLFDPDPYEDPVQVAPEDRYVSFSVTASVNTGATATAGDLKFGFANGAVVTIANYRRFTTKPSAPELVAAVKDTVAGFIIPGDLEDLQALPAGSIVTLNGTGTLKFSATADLLAAVNPLASASLPAPLPTVALKSGGSITVSTDVQLTGEYQIRAVKTGAQQIRLAYYRKSGQALAVKATASVGISAEVGGTELLTKVISAISSNAKVDEEELKKAGLTAGQIQAIEQAVEASVTRTVEIALSAELALSREEKAAFVYEIDMPSLTAASGAAIHSALHGDLSALTRDPSTALPGIRIAQDLFTNVRQRKYSLVINLFGIVNLGKVSTLLTVGKTMFEPSTGQLILSDAVTASRISSTAVNLGVADGEKLRHIVAETFLITVAYRGARASGLQPSLTSSHTFFALNQHTSQETLRDELDVSVALGLLTAADQARIAASAPEFGRTLFYAATNYDNSLATQLFVDGNRPRPVEFYETAGLQALACLVHPGDHDEARLRPTRDAQLWQTMKEQGQPGIPFLFRGVPDPVVGAIVADYSVIRWWSDAMHEMAVKLADMLAFLATHPAADDQNNDFKKLRNDLVNHLRSVATNTREEFGQPWGLLAMFIASGRRAGRRATLIGRNLSLTAENPSQLSLDAGGAPRDRVA
jgi:hypothetical protein